MLRVCWPLPASSAGAATGQRNRDSLREPVWSRRFERMPATLPYGLYARRTTPSTGVRRPSYRRFPISRRVRGVRWYNWSRCHVTVTWSPVVKREAERRETPVGEPSVEPNTPDPGERAGCRTAARRATSRRLALRVRGVGLADVHVGRLDNRRPKYRAESRKPGEKRAIREICRVGRGGGRGGAERGPLAGVVCLARAPRAAPARAHRPASQYATRKERIVKRNRAMSTNAALDSPQGPRCTSVHTAITLRAALTCARGRAGATRSPAIDRASRESHDVHARLEYRTIVLGGLSGASAWSLLLPELLPQGLPHHLLLLLLQLWSPPLL